VAGAAGSTNQAEGLGRSVGGYYTKLHAITDGLSNPIDFALTQGQASDIGQGQRFGGINADRYSGFYGRQIL
jgi:hypothetical protein